MIIGTAGHIDHGKTALVKALTGVDTDRLPEEKRRGITIDLGFAPLQLEGFGTIGMIDVPGHEDFVRSMLVGASGIDIGMLVIAADEGIMPQTREHLLILSVLEIPQLIVALTKVDVVEADWLELVRADIEALVGQTRWVGGPIVTCSARTGEGLDALRVALGAAATMAASRPSEDLFRLPVDRVFTVRGTGTVVTGTVWSGTVEGEADVRLLPGGAYARIRRIEQHGQTVPAAVAGVRAALALGGIDVGDVSRGSVIVADSAWRATTMFEALVTLDPDTSAELKSRTRVRFHSGATEVGVRVTPIDGSVLSPGAASVARVTADSPIPLRGGDRFVLRMPAPVGTIGGGVVIDPYARRRSVEALPVDDLRALALSGPKRLEWILEGEGVRGVPIADVPVRAGLTPAEAKAAGSESRGRGTNNLFSAAAVENTMAQVRMIIAEYEIQSPLSPGAPSRTLRGGLRANEELADIAIRELESAGEIETAGPLIRRKGWAPTPTALDLKASGALAHDICAAEREPPSVGELISRHGSGVPALLGYLEREGRIVKVEADRYYDRSAVGEMVGTLNEHLVPGQVYVPAQLRDVLGLSRKYLIPFLEFCDRKGITERRGEGRVLLESAGVVLDTFQPQP
ncbi:MAG: selenocysteine-specific translation elongation factor [Gemmatimonadota bacterium]|nr:selenocysteine-specific translation elongation factor [Gemmatimonadota bacterium]